MDELLSQVVGYLRGMWNYRWWGLFCAWLVGLGGAVFVANLPDRYESTARIYVDTQSILKPLMSGLAVQPNVNQQIAILSRTLISRPNIEKLMRMADLDIEVTTKEQREALISRLGDKLRISSTGRDNLYTLAYQDSRPDQAQRVVQSLVSIFVESGLGDKRKDSDSARRFIDDQISSYEQKLADAEDRLKNFKLKNMTLLGASSQGYVAQISEASDRVKQARLELQEAVNSRDALKRQLLDQDSDALSSQLPMDQGIGATPELDARIDAQKRSLDGLLLRFTEAHPDVLATRKVIADLETQKQEALESRKGNGVSLLSSSGNVVQQQMAIALSQSEANVASLRARVDEYERRYAELQDAAKRIPELEAELTQLNRDYGINKRNYDELLERRASAVMSSQMDTQAGLANFRLIDPPTLPIKPAAPNRTVLVPIAGLAGLVVGLALSFVLSQLRPTVPDARMLREITGLPVLGTVALLSNPARRAKERKRSVAFFGGLGGLVGAFAVLTVFVAMVRV
jgi:polysaccharide chain length determinant protein (PEP-CTERM system associated)